ncbi:NADH-quinone oxidoreductase subunit E [uncultured Roseibium sp.]|uniref:NADH-quinone oxidoreductase subunit E n=1 Tax=uncultured Roseibium sp. TaxID=1936171 RepID=UPI00261804E8|nr:NADH-quinone oxidoreductase subunit E [uncultured Roseibium sp.]
MAVRRLAAEQPESFEFTETNLAWAKKLIDRYPAGRQASAVIPLLWRAQEQNDGWVSEPAIRCVADLLEMPNIRVLEVATFYTMFQLQPVGTKAHIQVCGTTPCQLRGSEDLIKICKSRIATHMHEISEDGMFSWEEVECLGACVNAPMVQIYKDTYEDLTPESFEKLLDDISAGNEVTPGPQNGRRFAMAEGGLTSLTELNDDTEGALPLPHVVYGAEKASHAFAGAAINTGGKDYDGVPTPAEDAVAKVVAEHAAKAETKADTEPQKPAKVPAKAKAPEKDKPEAAKQEDAESAKAAKKAAPAKPKEPSAPAGGETVEEKAPETLTGPREGKADDLKKLKGVGPKLEATLHELGFYHFDQVANWGPAEVAWVDSRLKFKGRIERDGWIEQAKILAAGEDTEFSKRVDAGEVASSKSED